MPKITSLYLKKPTVQAQLKHESIPLPLCPAAFFESFYQTTCPISTQDFIATWNLHGYRSGGKCLHWQFFCKPTLASIYSFILVFYLQFRNDHDSFFCQQHEFEEKNRLLDPRSYTSMNFWCHTHQSLGHVIWHTKNYGYQYNNKLQYMAEILGKTNV